MPKLYWQFKLLELGAGCIYNSVTGPNRSDCNMGITQLKKITLVSYSETEGAKLCYQVRRKGAVTITAQEIPGQVSHEDLRLNPMIDNVLTVIKDEVQKFILSKVNTPTTNEKGI